MRAKSVKRVADFTPVPSILISAHAPTRRLANVARHEKRIGLKVNSLADNDDISFVDTGTSKLAG